MKNVLLLIVLLALAPLAKAEKIKFYITWSSQAENQENKDKLDLFCISLDGAISKKIDEYFPCATHFDFDDIKTALDVERQKQLLGVSDDATLQEIAGSLGAQYLIPIKIFETGSRIGIFVKCIDARKATTMVNEMAQGPNNEDAFEVINELADRFIEKLLRYEICPYKGKIKVEVQSDLDVDVSKEYPVYCNGQDRTYKMHYKENKHSLNYWTFEKVTRYSATAFIDYNLSEESEKEIEDGCYQCPSGKTRRYFKQTSSKKGKIDEVSEESQLEGKQIDDARIEITFNDDGTYTLKVDAASKATDFTETRYQYAESWCDSDNKPPQTLKNKTDIPLTYIFGPYQGTAKDESLTQHPDTFTTTDPVSGEKTTYTISFDLLKE